MFMPAPDPHELQICRSRPGLAPVWYAVKSLPCESLARPISRDEGTAGGPVPLVLAKLMSPLSSIRRYDRGTPPVRFGNSQSPLSPLKSNVQYVCENIPHSSAAFSSSQIEAALTGGV